MKLESLKSPKFEGSSMSKEMMSKVTGGDMENSIWGSTAQTDKIGYECTGSNYDKIVIAPDGKRTVYEKPTPWV